MDPCASLRVLVIGGTSFIGRATTEALLAAGASVTLANRGHTANPFGDVVRHISCDRRRHPDGLAAHLRADRWDAVVDLVAFCPGDVEPILQSASNIGRYIFISTDSVYMACNRNGFQHSASGRLLEGSDARRSDARAQKDKYGAEKLAAEAALRAAGGTLDWLALRLPDVLGPHENTGRLERLLLKLCKGQRIGTRLNGVDGADSAGLALSVVFAQDVATAVVGALSLPTEAPMMPPGQLRALHICASETPTWTQLVIACAEALRTHAIHVEPPRFDAAKDNPFVSVDVGALDGSAARAALPGWAPAPLAQRLDETVGWWVRTMRARMLTDEQAEASDAAVDSAASSGQKAATELGGIGCEPPPQWPLQRPDLLAARREQRAKHKRPLAEAVATEDFRFLSEDDRPSVRRE